MTALGAERRATSRSTDERSLNDVALVHAMGAGERDAASALYDRYGNIVYGLARCMLGDDAAAEATVIATFAHAVNGAGSFDTTELTVRTWLLALAQHDAILRVRARAHPQRA